MGLYSNNEPLLDKRLFRFLKMARTTLPNVRLYLFTNGTLLTKDNFDELMHYLDWLTIDNYNDELKLNIPVEEIYYYALSKSYKDKLYIYLRKENEILTNRSGQAKNRSPKKIKLKSACMYPYEQAIVRPDGKMSLCCNDATGKTTMGDLQKENLINIWRGEAYYYIRRKMLVDRNCHSLCKACDLVTPNINVGMNFKAKSIIKMFKELR
jgi:radical SAM protein with 4Fe4S-binding SPASM domain